MHKYDKIPNECKIKTLGEPNDILVIEEKVDGANGRFTIEKDKIIFGTRTVVYNNEKDYPKDFIKHFEYIKDIIDLSDKEVVDILKENIIYGEFMKKHTLEYEWNNIPLFICFDVYNKHNKYYIDYKERNKILKKLGFEIVPHITCKVKHLNLDKLSVIKSKYGNELAEGVVIKNYNKQIFIKKVRQEFKEENRKVFGNIIRKRNDFMDYILNRYCTKQRIDKKIYQLRDEKGLDIDLPMMKYLPTMIGEDIMEECGAEIYKLGLKRNGSIDFKSLTKRIGEMCRIRIHYLKKMG